MSDFDDMPLDEVHLKLYNAVEAGDEDGALDALMECKDQECMVCGYIKCPGREPLHFHHDGCPYCD